MAATTSKLFTDSDLEVASILCEIPTLILESAESPAQISRIRWGAKRRRTEPPYQINPTIVPPSSLLDDDDDDEESNKKRKKEENTASPATPLSFPTSGGEETAALAPAAKRVKNLGKHKEWVQEQNDMLTALSEGKADLLREIEEYKAKIDHLYQLNSLLKTHKLKLKKQAEEMALGQSISMLRGHITYVGPTATANQIAGADPPWSPPPAAAKRRPFDIDLNTPAPEAAAAVEAEMTWNEERARRAATSAQARKLRLEKQKEKLLGMNISRSPSTVHNLPRHR